MHLYCPHCEGDLKYLLETDTYHCHACVRDYSAEYLKNYAGQGKTHKVYFVGGPWDKQVHEVGVHDQHVVVNIPTKVDWSVDPEVAALSLKQYAYQIHKCVYNGSEYRIAYAGAPGDLSIEKLADMFGWPKLTGKELPCLRCQAMRLLKFDLKKDWYVCTICQQAYTPDEMAQVRPNFTYPATAQWLRSHWPFFVASAYPKEYQKQLLYKKSQQAHPAGKSYHQSGHAVDLTSEYKKQIEKLKQKMEAAASYDDHYAVHARIEFEGVEELDPSLWGDPGDAGLL